MYWAIIRDLVAMLTFDRCLVSCRTAWMASRTSALTEGWPPLSRSQRSSAQPITPSRSHRLSHRISVRAPACPSDSSFAS